jgi:opacity protein-like surface antigen
MIRRMLFLALFAVTSALAQDFTERAPDGSIELGVWGAGSVGNGHVFGFLTGRQLTLLGVRLAFPVRQRKSFVLKYKVDAVPLAILDDPLPGVASRVYGAGGSPVGAELKLRRFWRIRPFFDTGGGALYFPQRRVLSPDASHFNFTVELGGGIETAINPHTAFVFGYRYQHLSNANISTRNPGVDSHFLFGGLTFAIR